MPLIHFVLDFLPPSSNSQYVLVRRGRKTYHVPSRDLTDFQKRVADFHVNHPSITRSFKESAAAWIASHAQLEIRTTFYFAPSRLFTKTGKPKKLDVSNRIKALHDCVSKLVGIDDCYFFSVFAEKRVLSEGENERVEIEILNIHP